MDPDDRAVDQALKAFGNTLRRRLREQADVGDLTPSQVDVLLRLEADGPATTSGLARRAGMRPQSMGTIIAALESAGLVGGAPDPADGRQTLLSLTDHCCAWLAEGRAIRQDWLARAIDARLSAPEREQLGAVIPLLMRLVENRGPV